MIRVQGLRKSFDGRLAVRDLSFQASDGAITGLLGSNGAGKTTTLRMICGVLKPDTGSIFIDDIAGEPLARQQRLGALLDHIGIYSRLTVRENLSYFGRLRGMPPELLKERIQQVTSILGLESIADRRTSGFSQGQRMKTALGRALLHAPQNLLLDEPTNGCSHTPLAHDCKRQARMSRRSSAPIDIVWLLYRSVLRLPGLVLAEKTGGVGLSSGSAGT